MNILSKNKVVLGLSGGVDSTTAALLLKEKGMEVIGFYFDVTGINEKDKNAAENLANKLNIEFYSADVSKEFNEKIVRNFCAEYCCGRTPNPCTICNPLIKFRKLIDLADKLGAYYIATGHYARVFHDEKSNLYYIQKGVNEKKDQSYMLYRLDQSVLSRMILPLGNTMDKEETRELSRQFKMPNAEAKDSQEICFIDETKESYIEFIERKCGKAEKGNFVDAEGNILGQHQGISHYTVGQRKGLGIALGRPVFVTSINPEKNEIVLGDNSDLLKNEVYSDNNVFAAPDQTEALLNIGDIEVEAKIRYAARPSKARIRKKENGIILTIFDEAQRAATPGQSIVFYIGDNVIGGGFITNEQC